MNAATRDYSLTGAESQRARELGLADAEWFRPPVDPHRMQQLMQRTNGRAAADTLLWLALLIGAGVWAYRLLWSWWAVPVLVVYGALYGGAADSRWHECGHGTAFRARWVNDVVYYVASFMLFREPTLWRWSHVRHHSDTIVVGRDPEVAFPRPMRLHVVLANQLNLLNGMALLRRMAAHALGRLDEDAKDYIPRHEWRRVVWEARGCLLLLGGVLTWSLIAQSVVPLLFVGLPTFYGGWLMLFFAATQHAGLRENVTDHRLNTRTVYMNPVLRFLYLNMNYHLEHHLFPTVPYRSLPALHREVQAYLPAPKRSVAAAYREIIPTVLRQRRDPSFDLPLPSAPHAAIATAVHADTAAVAAADVAGVASMVAAGGVDLGALEDLAVGQLRRVDLGGRYLLLCRWSSDEVALTDGVCTHGRGHLADGLLDGCEVECPIHNGRFDVRTGEPTRRPATVRLGRHDVAVFDGRIIAAIGDGDG